MPTVGPITGTVGVPRRATVQFELTQRRGPDDQSSLVGGAYICNSDITHHCRQRSILAKLRNDEWPVHGARWRHVHRSRWRTVDWTRRRPFHGTWRRSFHGTRRRPLNRTRWWFVHWTWRGSINRARWWIVHWTWRRSFYWSWWWTVDWTLRRLVHGPVLSCAIRPLNILS